MKRLLTYCMALMMTAASCKKSETPVDVSNLPAENIMNVSYGSDAQQKMDIYLPAGRNTNGTKALILLHGGAWMSGDKSEMTGAVTALQSLLPDYAFFNVNYRLAHSGGNLWPAQSEDINTAVDFIISHADHYKYSSSLLAIGGASAGAHLALLKAYSSGGNIKAVVDMFGPTDMKDLYNNSTSSTQYVLSFFMSGTPISNPSAYTGASPLFAVNTNSAPTIILHGTADNLVPVHQSDSLYNRLVNAGATTSIHKYTGEGHGIWSNANTLDAYAKISAFLKLHVK